MSRVGSEIIAARPLRMLLTFFLHAKNSRRETPEGRGGMRRSETRARSQDEHLLYSTFFYTLLSLVTLSDPDQYWGPQPLKYR